jgi:hypothetical protein
VLSGLDVYRRICLEAVAEPDEVGEIVGRPASPAQVLPEVSPMIGRKTAQPELYASFSLEAAVPTQHILRKIAACIDFEFVRSLAASYYSQTASPQ